MKRFWPVLLIAIPAVLFVWTAVPYNNFLLNNALLADDYLMPISVLVILIVVGVLQPLLRLFSPRARLSGSQLALIFSIALVAALAPSGGFLRQSLHPLAMTVHRANHDVILADAYQHLNPPPGLYPAPLGYEVDIPDVDAFVGKLAKDQPIPWRAWGRPLASWMGFVGPWFLMMTATAVIFFGYWRDNERVPFPLLGILQALVDVPDDGPRTPAIFRTRAFWTACGTVFCLHALGQSHRYVPASVPDFPLSWHLWACFTEVPWRHMPSWIVTGTIYFTFLGIGFFLPRRIAFSIWAFQIAYAVYIMLLIAYSPSDAYVHMRDHRTGAFFAFPLFVLWLGRAHVARVAKTLVTPAATAEDRAYRMAGAAFLAGLAGMFVWLLWVQVPWPWAAGLTLAGFLYGLTLTRVVAETGLPLFFAETDCLYALLRFIPAAWRTAAGMYFSGVLAVWYGPGQRVCVATVMAQALGMNRRHKAPQHVRLGLALFLLLLVSIVGAGVVHLHITYRHDSTLNGNPIAWWGRGQFGPAERLLIDTVRGVPADAISGRVSHLCFGAGLMLALYILCQLTPLWPLHPVGLLCVGTWSLSRIWPNIFLGWLAKTLILRYGGLHAHRKAKAVFLGLIMGEVLAMIFWSCFAGGRAALGMEYHSVNILPY